MRKRRGQEEMVGFVLIVILVAVIILVFLGISIRKGGVVSTTESSDVYQFLESSMEVTSECAIRFVPDYASMGELFKECYTGSNCIDEGSACEVLNASMHNILASSWNVGNQSAIKGYELKAWFSTNSSANEEFLSISEGFV